MALDLKNTGTFFLDALVRQRAEEDLRDGIRGLREAGYDDIDIANAIERAGEEALEAECKVSFEVIG